MKLGSLFDGSGGFPLAARMCGIEPVWASEIEEYPIRVTKKNFPNMKHLGDITKINGAEIEPVDIITFGSPCQDLSIAGNRAGMKHTEKGDDETTRSGLFYEAIRVIKEMRDATQGRYPTFIIWENVFGAFSSNNGDDFWAVLNTIGGIAEDKFCTPRLEKWTYAGEILADGFSIAYRTLDLQYWGCPQMRRRVFLVADFRGQRAGEILFEREGLSRDFEEIRKEGQKTATDTGAGSAITIKERCGKPGGGKGVLIQHDKAASLECNSSQGVMLMQMSSPDAVPRFYEDKTPTLKTNGDTVGGNLAVFYANQTSAQYAGPMENSPTLLGRMGTGGNNTPLVAKTYRKVSRAKSKDDATTWAETDTACTLNTFDMGETRVNELVVEDENI